MKKFNDTKNDTYNEIYKKYNKKNKKYKLLIPLSIVIFIIGYYYEQNIIIFIIAFGCNLIGNLSEQEKKSIKIGFYEGYDKGFENAKKLLTN